MSVMSRSVVGAMVVLILGFAALLGPGAAVAKKSDVYDNFKRCPTSAPEMNDPAKRGVVCASNTVREGSFQVGNLRATLSSPANIQFAFTVEEGAEEEDPQTIALVSGSTSMEGPPLILPNPFYTPPAAAPGVPPQPLPAARKKKRKKAHHKRHRKCKKHQRKCKRAKHKKHKKKPKRPVAPAPVVTVPPVAADPFIKIAVETVGDLRKFDIQSIFGEAGPLYELPVKFHLEGTGLGPSCFIGSESAPIVLAPEPVSPFTSFQIGSDPNGLGVELLSLGGSDTEDDAFTVPAARGCGTLDSSGGGSLDATVNGLIGLPAPEGASKALFGNLLIEMAAAIIDGTPPDGGAALQQAFEAAG